MFEIEAQCTHFFLFLHKMNSSKTNNSKYIFCEILQITFVFYENIRIGY